jgi:hypothetical membrane protein
MGKKSQIIKIGAYTGIITLILDTFIITFLHFFTPNYNWMTQYMSEMGVPENPFSWIFNSWLFLYTPLMIFFVIGLYLSLSANKFGMFGPVLLFLDTLGAGVLSGLFPCAAGCEGTSLSNIFHLISGGISTFAGLLLPIGLYFGIKNDKRWATLKKPLIIYQLVIFLFFIFDSYFELMHLSGQRDPYIGLRQRLYTLIYYSLLFLIAKQMLRLKKQK